MIIRVKDRINNPMKGSGYRDVMMNVEIDNHVGELQLSLAPLLDVKSSGTRSIALRGHRVATTGSSTCSG